MSARSVEWFSDEDKAKFANSALNFSRVESNTSSDILTPMDKATGYNNFYEFGTDKEDPIQHSQSFKVDPCS